MRKKVMESSILFVSIVKWLFLASCAGILVGIYTTVFFKILEAGISFAGSYRYYFIAIPAAFVLSVLLVKYFAPQAAGHGTEKIIEAVHRYSGKINPLVVQVAIQRLFGTKKAMPKQAEQIEALIV